MVLWLGVVEARTDVVCGLGESLAIFFRPQSRLHALEDLIQGAICAG